MHPALVLAAAVTLIGLAGCGKSNSSSPSATAAPAQPPSAASGPREIDLTAGDNMKYNITSITAQPGEELKVVLTNVGNVPKEAMAHNFVLLKAGSDAAAFDAAALSQKANGYIPPSLENEIIARIPLVGPHESASVEFKAPETPGEYPYLCTFPAHYQVGMHGTLTVQ